MRSGFTLIEVVVSLLLLEVAVLAAAGTMAVAAGVLAEAEHLERAVLEAEGVLDSLAGAAAATSGSRPYRGGITEWTVDPSGALDLRVLSPDGEERLAVTSAVGSP